MRTILPLALLAACKGSDPHDSAPIDTDPDTDVVETDLPNDTGIPDDPRPISITVSGAYTGTLVFDEPSCTWTESIPNFRAFWRNGSGQHVFVLLAEVLGSFAGPGTYDETMPTTRVKLQEEAGGQGLFFSSEGGDTVAITVTGLEEGQAWGEFSFSGMADGGIQVEPQPVPIWCPELL